MGKARLVTATPAGCSLFAGFEASESCAIRDMITIVDSEVATAVRPTQTAVNAHFRSQLSQHRLNPWGAMIPRGH